MAKGNGRRNQPAKPSQQVQGQPSPPQLRPPGFTGFQVAQQVQILRKGPLPEAAELAGYDQVLPGAADRIIRMAEIQAMHRQEMEKLTVQAAIRDTGRGQIFAFILAAGTISGGVFLLTLGKDVSGYIALTGGIAALIAPFIWGRQKQQQSAPKPPSEGKGVAKKP